MCIGANGWNPGNTYAKGIVFGASAIGIGGLGGGVSIVFLLVSNTLNA